MSHKIIHIQLTVNNETRTIEAFKHETLDGIRYEIDITQIAVRHDSEGKWERPSEINVRETNGIPEIAHGYLRGFPVRHFAWANS